ERAFQCSLVLGRDKNNQVEVQLPEGMKDNLNNRLQFAVDCKAPQRGQRLHLLVLGVGQQDEKQLEEQVMKALNGDNPDTPRRVFESIKIHGILTGENLRRRKLEAYHRDIKLYIERQKKSELRAMAGNPLNDVIVYYYRGAEAIDRGRFLQTDPGQTPPQVVQAGLPFEEIQRMLADTPGARLVLLDVARTGGRTPTRPPETRETADLRRVGVLSSSWLAQAETPSDASLTAGLEQAVSSVRGKGVALRDVIG